MQILVAKAEKRARDEGKETVFLHGGSEIGPERFDHFKRRKTTQAMEAASPSAGMLNLLPECVVQKTDRWKKHHPTSHITHLEQTLRAFTLGRLLPRRAFQVPEQLLLTCPTILARKHRLTG
jgi:hypothetical protein